MVPTRTGGRAVELPMLGYVAAGLPIEAITSNETISVPEDFVGKRDTYVLRVRGGWSSLEAPYAGGWYSARTKTHVTWSRAAATVLRVGP